MEPKEGTEKWEDKDSWCVSFVADCLIAGGEKGITRDLSYLTEELRKRINEIVLSEKAESFKQGQEDAINKMEKMMMSKYKK